MRFSRFTAALFIVLGIEIGMFLIVLPWIPFWDKNLFVAKYPWVEAIAQNNFVRGAISGIGLADLWLAFESIWRMHRSSGKKS